MRKNEISLYEDPFFGNFFFGPLERHYPRDRKMRTDIKEVGDNYEFDIELPGIKKEDINIELEDGNLTVSYTEESSNDVKDGETYIRRERFFGSQSRSFYVGDNITKEDIKAKFENGVLNIVVPKDKPKEKVSSKIEIL